jgi:amino acid transporter
VTLLSLLKVLNGNFISATRMTFSISRNEFLSKSLSRLSKNTKVPTNSLLLISGLSILGIFFGRMGLITLAEIGSFAISVAWFFTSIACFIHAKQGRIVNLKLGMITGIIGSLVSFALIATKILWFIPGHLVTTHYLVLLVWLFFGLTLYFYNEKSKKAQLAQ